MVQSASEALKKRVVAPHSCLISVDLNCWRSLGLPNLTHLLKLVLLASRSEKIYSTSQRVENLLTLTHIFWPALPSDPYVTLTAEQYPWYHHNNDYTVMWSFNITMCVFIFYCFANVLENGRWTFKCVLLFREVLE